MRDLKIVIKCLSVLSVCFVFQAVALNKVEVFNHYLPEALDLNLTKEAASEEVEEVSFSLKDRKGAKLNSPNKHPVVSHAVLFEDKQPVCVASTVGKPDLVPHFMRVKEQESSQASGINLPPCDDFQLSVLEAKAREALLINGDKLVQTAVAAVAPALILCLFGSAAGFGADVAMSGISTAGVVALAGGVGGALYFNQLYSWFLSRFIGLSVSGICGVGTYYAVGYLKDLL